MMAYELVAQISCDTVLIAATEFGRDPGERKASERSNSKRNKVKQQPPRIYCMAVTLA